MKKFKSSLRGFKKSDVNNFIIEMNREFSEEKNSLEDTIASLKGKINSLEAELNTSKAELELLTGVREKRASLEEDLAQKSGRISSLEAELSALSEENATLKEEIQAQKAQNASVSEDNARLKAMLDAFEALEFSEEANMLKTKSKTSQSGERAGVRSSLVRPARTIVHEADETSASASASYRMSEFKRYIEKLLFASKHSEKKPSPQYIEMIEKLLEYCNTLEHDTAKSFSEFKKNVHRIYKELKGELSF